MGKIGGIGLGGGIEMRVELESAGESEEELED